MPLYLYHILSPIITSQHAIIPFYKKTYNKTNTPFHQSNIPNRISIHNTLDFPPSNGGAQNITSIQKQAIQLMLFNRKFNPNTYSSQFITNINKKQLNLNSREIEIEVVHTSSNAFRITSGFLLALASGSRGFSLYTLPKTPTSQITIQPTMPKAKSYSNRL